MRLDEHVRGDHLVLQLRVFPDVPRILRAAHVEPRPSVKPAVLHVRDVVGHQIVAEVIALVDGHPELTRLRMEGKADGVPDAGRI